MEDGKGNMHSSFVVISNMNKDINDTVKRGAERVLRARLEDARFYYFEDQKRALHDYVDDLKKVTFQEKLGSVHEKALRVSAICSFLADELNLPFKENLIRAAMLCKADLVTGVVGEFPELQGYMGMTYALNSGEDEELATALHEHYLPKFAGDMLPQTPIGSILSIADKMDNITSFFFLDMVPTGSEDPFALRRQAMGVVNILQNTAHPISLNTLINRSLQSLEGSEGKRSKLTGQILQFFRQRLEGVYLSQGFTHDIVNAVLAAEELDMTIINRKIHALASLKKDPSFPSMLTAAKRAYNILSKVQPGAVNEDLLTDPSEKALFSAVRKVRETMGDNDYPSLFELEKPINTFFDSVLVMDKNPGIKENRLALLLTVKEAFNSLADFSKIQE
jgi:glycyl-tRNA synthetase beta chain